MSEFKFKRYVSIADKEFPQFPVTVLKRVTDVDTGLQLYLVRNSAGMHDWLESSVVDAFYVEVGE